MTGIFSPKIPKQEYVPAPVTPTRDMAMERDTTMERLKYRRGALATRLTRGYGGGGGAVARFRALGATSR